jgi:hypothetical protein
MSRPLSSCLLLQALQEQRDELQQRAAALRSTVDAVASRLSAAQQERASREAAALERLEVLRRAPGLCDVSMPRNVDEASSLLQRARERATAAAAR